MTSAGSNRSGTKRWRCAPGGVYCSGLTGDAPKTKPPKRVRFVRSLGGKQRFIVTAAQNGTPVHEKWWQTLLVAAKAMDATLVVIPIRYKNPTSLWTASQKGWEWWVPEVFPYLFDGRKKLGPNLVLVGDVKTQPTASMPLTGFEGLTGGESCIMGHTKLQFRTVPVPAGRTPKILTTTGACTMPNFTDTRAGKLGQFHHTYGATIVECDGRRFHVRQFLWDEKGQRAIDLNHEYSPAGVKPAPPALALVMGDTHVRFADPAVVEATLAEEGSMVAVLNPDKLVWHDVCDNYATNPHHANNPFVAIAKARSRYGDAEAETRETVKFLDDATGSRESIVVGSNHNDFLSRWIVSRDWRTDPSNAEFYLETALAMARSVEMGAGGAEYADPFGYWVKKLSGNSHVRVLKRDESVTIAGIECGMHGDDGPNGARGSIKNLSRLGAKTIIGHSHSPGIQEGAYQCGTSTPLKLEYTHGPSSWLNTHVVIYASGKRSLLTVIDGKWRA